MAKKKMAIVGLSGRVGNFVFRRQKSDDKAFEYSVLLKSDEEPGETQKLIQCKFPKAKVYEKAAISDPSTKALFAAKASGGRSVFNVAVADHFNAPQIEQINLDNCSGEQGIIIKVVVTDDFAVCEVKVKIENQDRTLVEAGESQADESEFEWGYTAKILNENLAGDKITVTAYNMPGNTDKQEQKLSAI